MKHVVALVSDFPPGTRSVLEVGGRSIGVFNVEGRFFALRNRCPHQGGPLCDGSVLGSVAGDRPGEYAYDLDRPQILCPWHGWEFDLDTGQSWFDPLRIRVRSYDVDIETGEELVRDASGRVPGPFTAETFQVSVEGRYVVVAMD